MELEESIEEIKTFAEKENITLIKGASIDSEKGNSVSFLHLQNFLEFVKLIEIKVIFVSKTLYNEEKFNQVVKELEEEDIEELKKEYSSYFGKVDSINAFCIYQETLFIYDEFGCWRTELRKKIKEDYEDVEEDDSEEDDEIEKVKCLDCENILNSWAVENGEKYCSQCIERKRKEGKNII